MHAYRPWRPRKKPWTRVGMRPGESGLLPGERAEREQRFERSTACAWPGNTVSRELPQSPGVAGASRTSRLTNGRPASAS